MTGRQTVVTLALRTAKNGNVMLEMAHTDDADEIPLIKINLDHIAFDRLNDAEREYFYFVARRLEELGYMKPRGRAAQEWAYLDFDAFKTFGDYLAQCRKIHKGNAVRDALKAERKGYYSKFFNPRVFVADIVAVNTSAENRQGGPMSPHYFLPVERRGGYPTALEPEVPPTQPFLWTRHWGLFRSNPGHRQGDVVVDEELLAYCIVRRCSEFMYYSTILGHWDYLRDGVTYKMHLDFAKTVLDLRNTPDEQRADRSLEGARYLFYARFFTVSKGLQMWKERMLFRPGHFEFDYPKQITPPAVPSPLAVVSSYEARLDADYAAAGFAPGPVEKRINLVLLGGQEEPLTSDVPINSFHGFTQQEGWRAVKGVLIGGSIVDQHHALLTEALAQICGQLCPNAEIFTGRCNRPASAPSAIGRRFGEWMLRQCARADGSEAVPRWLVPAAVIEGAAHRGMGLDLLLRRLVGEKTLANVIGIGGGIGLIVFFCLAGRQSGTPLAVTIIDHLTHYFEQTRDLYACLGGNGVSPAPAPALALVPELPDDILPADRHDLIVLDAAIWRFAENVRPAMFRKLWESLRRGGVMAVNAVVRSDAGGDDPHDRNFAHAPTRHSMIEMMSIDRRPTLYRAAGRWQAPEDPAAVPASGYGTNSFLVAVKD